MNTARSKFERIHALGSTFFVLVRIPAKAERFVRDAPAASDLADDLRFDVGTQRADHVLRVVFRREDREPHPHVVGLVHLAALEPSERLELAEDALRWERLRDSEGGVP